MEKLAVVSRAVSMRPTVQILSGIWLQAPARRCPSHQTVTIRYRGCKTLRASILLRDEARIALAAEAVRRFGA